MTRILGISGSLRAGSYNTSLLRAAQAVADDSIELEIATLHGIPLYDGDVEQREGLPAAVTALKEKIVACHGVLLATPEYNNGIPGVFKNAIDWLSRPPADIARVFAGRPFAVVGASPGGFGTILAQQAWLPVLRTLGVRNWAGGRLMVPRANAAIGEAGVDRVRAVAEWHPNAGVEGAEPIYQAFRERLRDPRDDYFNMRHVVMIEMLAAAIEAAGSTDALAVARALEGRAHRGEPYAATMRAADHQLLTPLYVSVMQRAGSGATAADSLTRGLSRRVCSATLCTKVLICLSRNLFH